MNEFQDLKIVIQILVIAIIIIVMKKIKNKDRKEKKYRLQKKRNFSQISSKCNNVTMS